MPRHPLVPPPIEELDLTRTSAALACYDAAAAELEARAEGEVEVATAAFEALRRAETQVGEAFALDTADRNDPEVAQRQGPGPWMRGLVNRWLACRRTKVRQEGTPLEPVEVTRGYLALRGEAIDRANERLEAIDAPTTARDGEERGCEKYEECFELAAARNAPCVPCGVKATKKQPGCPLFEEKR